MCYHRRFMAARVPLACALCCSPAPARQWSADGRCGVVTAVNWYDQFGRGVRRVKINSINNRYLECLEARQVWLAKLRSLPAPRLSLRPRHPASCWALVRRVAEDEDKAAIRYVDVELLSNECFVRICFLLSFVMVHFDLRIRKV